jgi:predicted deacylase
MRWRPDSLPVAGAAPIETYTLTAATPGPLLAVFGGVHGDEPEGVFATRTIAGMDLDLICGEVVVVPVAHPAAFAADTRTGPDGDNLARVFPGKADGTPTERVAAALTEHILSKADALVDLHTAGRHYDMALLAGFGSSPGPARDMSRKMAEAFGADVVWLHPGTSTGRTLSVMQARGKPAIYTEAPGGARLERKALDRYVEGVQRVMAALGMLAPLPPLTRPSMIVNGAGNTDEAGVSAPVAGHFCAAVSVGDVVRAGDPLGHILRLDAPPLAIEAPQDGAVMYLRRTARIAAGEAIAILAGLGPGDAA